MSSGYGTHQDMNLFIRGQRRVCIRDRVLEAAMGGLGMLAWLHLVLAAMAGQLENPTAVWVLALDPGCCRCGMPTNAMSRWLGCTRPHCIALLRGGGGGRRDASAILQGQLRYTMPISLTVPHWAFLYFGLPSVTYTSCQHYGTLFLALFSSFITL